LKDDAVGPGAAEVSGDAGRDAAVDLVGGLAGLSRRLAGEQGRAIGVVLRPGEHKAVIVEREEDLVIVPRIFGSPPADDVFKDGAERAFGWQRGRSSRG